MAAYIIPQTTDYATASANTEVTLTYAAVAGRRHQIHQVVVSYSATPTGGKVQIKRATSVVFEADITAGGPTVFNFEEPISGIPGEAVSVVLAAGSGAVVGKISAGHKRI